MQAASSADPCDSINYMMFCNVLPGAVQAVHYVHSTSRGHVVTWLAVTNYFTQFKVDQQRSQGLPHQELFEETKGRFSP